MSRMMIHILSVLKEKVLFSNRMQFLIAEVDSKNTNFIRLLLKHGFQAVAVEETKRK